MPRHQGGSGQLHVSAVLLPTKEPHKLGVPQGPSECKEESLAPNGNRTLSSLPTSM
jgi:hypothetical protein